MGNDTLREKIKVMQDQMDALKNAMNVKFYDGYMLALTQVLKSMGD